MRTIKLFSAVLFALSLEVAVQAQSVIFPQEQQPGTAVAVAASDGNTFTLSNDLFSASFIRDNGSLFFGGSDALGLQAGTELFSLRLGNGTEVKASEMQLGDVQVVMLRAEDKAVKGALHFAGYAIEASFVYKDLSLLWRAVLRDGSHYLRTELEITAKKDVAMKAIVPMIYEVACGNGHQPAVVGNTRGAVIASDLIFAGLETPMGLNSVGSEMSTQPFVYDSWDSGKFTWEPGDETPQAILDLGFTTSYIRGIQGYLAIKEAGKHTVHFQYTSGYHRLDIAGVDALDLQTGAVVASDYHKGTTGGKSSQNTYTLDIPEAGYYLIRYFRDCTEEVDGTISTAFNSNGTITWSGNVSAPKIVYDGGTSVLEENVVHLPAATSMPIRGEWSRQTTLESGTTWKVSAVVGLIAPGQARRSFLAYSERERAVPWRPFPLYNSWFELNINRNNDPNYTTNFNESQCLDVLNQWKTHLYDAHGTGIASFVWDDGWDQYGTWTFNKNFPNGFEKISDAATSMQSQIGAWLGPVGGYGQSGNYRRNYWSGRGGMQLSNKAYFDTFLKACSNMLNNYAFNFFKFDGISAQFSAVGPDAGATGEENAEGIIEIERRVRAIKPDVFLNTTVGTWASPFWFQFTDAVWRQENDFDKIGDQGTDRERWITYRDRLVYKNFVQNSPLCPINTLMTHGFILTEYSNAVTDRSYNSLLRELRCAFACGSGMVEIYADYALMNSINNGKLWADLAECIRWQQENADVLPDVHWVGGNPWDGSKANVYGWASWNGKKATLALRNPSTESVTYKSTLREMLDIPEYIHTTITLSKAFSQKSMTGLMLNTPIDIDKKLSMTIPASTACVFNGVDGSVDAIKDIAPQASVEYDDSTYDLAGRRLVTVNQPGLYIRNGQKIAVR